MNEPRKPFTTDPDAAREARKRAIEQDPVRRDNNKPDPNDPASEPGDNRREEAPFNIDVGVTRRAD